MYSREYVGVYQRENDEKNGRCFLDYNQEVNLVEKKKAGTVETVYVDSTYGFIRTLKH